MSEAIQILERILYRSTRRGECLTCNLGLSTYGYARIWIEGKEYRITRLLMHLVKDFPLDSELDILHKEEICKDKACIEIDHLKIGNDSENRLDVMNRKDFIHPRANTICPKHPKIKREKDIYGRTRCPICRSEYQKEYRRKNKKK